MRKIRKLLITFILILVMCPLGVLAEETSSETSSETENPTTSFNCGNDGQPKATADECFQDSGLVSSFANVEYVDCAVPYAITYAQLGGSYEKTMTGYHEWDDPNNLGGVYTFSSNITSYFKDKNVGDKGNRENDYSAGIMAGCVRRLNNKYNGYYDNVERTLAKTLSIQREAESGANYVEVNGIRYYIAAIGSYFFQMAADTTGQSWVNNGEYRQGSIFDVILTDGKVFHFIMGDAIGVDHSVQDNKTVYFYKCTKVGDSHSSCSNASNRHAVSFTSLIKPYYKGIVHASAGQILELWFAGSDQGYAGTSVDKQPVFKYLAENEGVHIAYIRRYNLTVENLETVQLNTGVPKGASWKMIYGANSAEAQALNAGGNAKALRVGYKEQELSSWTRLAESNLSEVLDNATLDKLNGDELTAIYNWKTIATDSNAPIYLKVIRIVVQIIGVLMLIWAILLYLGYQFDKINNLVDIQIVSILTLGKLQSGDNETSTYGKSTEMEKNGKVKVVSHRNILLICFVVILFAVLILTGALYNLLTFLIYTILDFF